MTTSAARPGPPGRGAAAWRTLGSWLRRLVWACLLVALCQTAAHAWRLDTTLRFAPPSVNSNPVDEAQLLALAAHPTWQRLLHMGGQGRSEINSPEFFLSPQGARDPAAELRATLAAYAQPWPSDTNQHARCVFPARFDWLARQLPLPGYQPREPRCKRLEAWARFDQLQSVSVFLVSGYFGNPASTFGHALLKFNTRAQPLAGGLLDVSVNFGAAVPDNEPTVLYVARGLLGGYQAGFSDREHYANDLIYGHTEFRDMWDYELALTPRQRDFLVKHVAEIAGKKFDYYFLNENCGLRLARVLELALERPVVGSARHWYAPVEMFHALHGLDAAGPPALLGPPRFVPSAQRVLRHQFSLLSPSSLQLTQGVMRDMAREAAQPPPATPPDVGANHGGEPAGVPLTSLAKRLAALPMIEQLDALDALLAYQEYKLVAQGPQPDPADRRIKDGLLLARLQLPPRSTPRPSVPQLPSPALGHATVLTALGSGHDPDRGALWQLRLAAFSYEHNGFHGLDNGELAVLDARLSGGQQHGVRLDALDVIRVRKLDVGGGAWPGEQGLSWQLALGLRRAWTEQRWARQHHASMGVGRASRWGPATGFAMLTGAVHSGPGWLDTGLLGGVFGGNEAWRWSAQLGWRAQVGGPGQPLISGEADLQWRWGSDRVWRLELQHEGRTRGGLSLRQYW